MAGAAGNDVALGYYEEDVAGNGHDERGLRARHTSLLASSRGGYGWQW